MLIIPAIDIYQGQCVRLRQGDFTQKTVYYPDPLDAAVYWYEQGAQRLHIVDLDGAKFGNTVNFKKITQICQSINIPIQIGGGIRTIKQINQYFENGLNACILGTSAITNQSFFNEACQTYPKGIIAGLDAKGENLAISGWQQDSQQNIFDYARWVEKAGAAQILYTDIQRDGMLTGLNLEILTTLASVTKIPIIASGGVANIDDIYALNKLINIFGVIIGKAFYQKTLDFKLAQKTLNHRQVNND